MKNISIVITLFKLLLCSLYANAIEINSLFQIADHKGETVFIIKNTEDKRLFLNVGMFEVNIVDGELQQTPYTRDNIKDWKINVKPARTIIDSGYSKDFRVKMNCGVNCNDDRDQMFSLAFVPSPYIDNDDKPQHAVQMAVGFSAIYLYPGKDQPLNYKVSYKDNKLNFINNSKSYIEVIINSCKESGFFDVQDIECSKTIRVLSGRHLDYILPDNMQKDKLFLNIKTHKGIYQESIVVNKE